MVRHLFKLLFDAIESHRYILHRDAHDSGNLLVAHILEPKQHDGAVEGFELVDAFVEHLYLARVLVLVLKEVDVHGQWHRGLLLLLTVRGDASVQAHSVDPRIHQLKPFDRAIVLLWLENMSYEEIAAIVGITVKNVSVRLYRIKEQLKQMSNQ